MINCKICGKECKGLQALSNHLGLTHKINTYELKQQYYDTYMKKENEGICQKCGNITHFQSLNRGYTMYCCKSCQVSAQNNASKPEVRQKMRQTMKERYGYEEIFSNPEVILKSHYKISNNKKCKSCVTKNKKHKSSITKNKNLHKENCSFKTEPVKAKIKQTKLLKYGSETYNNPNKTKQTINDNNKKFEIKNNCTQIGTLIAKYGQGWKALDLPIIIKNHNAHFISNDYIPLIEQYVAKNHNYRSKKETQLFNDICDIYHDEILHNCRKVIPHYELDVYIPKLRLAVEYNGVKWHSIENGMDKEYHLKKSLICKQYNIRLIHIYEHESYNKQLELLKQLIYGYDNYPEKDFNKNNLISSIPEPEIIYKSNYYTVYGAGKLY